jgi:hypothetical protein
MASVCTAGAISGAAYSIVVTPFELVKCNAQKQHTHTLSALKTIRAQLGVVGMYRGLGAALVRDVSQSVAYYACAEHLNRSPWLAAVCGPQYAAFFAVCVRVWMCVDVYMYVSVCLLGCVSICGFVHVHDVLYVWVCVRTHIHTCTDTHAGTHPQDPLPPPPHTHTGPYREKAYCGPQRAPTPDFWQDSFPFSTVPCIERNVHSICIEPGTNSGRNLSPLSSVPYKVGSLYRVSTVYVHI